MAIRSKKPCKKFRCKNLTQYPNKYCDLHSDLEEKEKYQMNKQYDFHIRNKRDRRYSDFYHSTEWIKVRQLRLTIDNGLCQQCLKDKKITLADVVHHKVELKDDWSKRVDVDNLLSLCHKCHNTVHSIPPSY
ncbi:HNH endonuclease [Clostridium tetani]|uniref:Putative HNH nuclease YajD n=1 Tax=Clostridium tetani TaxID=1513 RepID=A0ABY0ETD2_CLOTA|nr:HNH endonuclease [Clostridium tetani]RXI58977.1 HNH endonuclease [Clostridium tetani]